MKSFIRLNILAILFFCLSSILANSGSISDVDVKWDFQSTGEDQYGNPSTIISLVVNGKKYEIAKELGNYSEITSINFKDYKFPKNALVACSGWWAGAGADYWVIQKGNNLNVFMREISEGDPDHPGDYVTKPKKVKTISLE